MRNGTMMQYFQWYTPADGTLWDEAGKNAPELARLGINSVWLPPAYKGIKGPEASGYDVYDIYDLGEFDQKGSIRTKYGTKEQYRKAVDLLHKEQIQVYVDIVLNHKGGADELERIRVKKADPEDRTKFISDPFEIEAYTKFTFPGRNKKYSEFVWDHRCFTGVDRAANNDENGIFSILNEYGEGWEEVIDTEKGNYDFLMIADIEFRNEAVREELKRWGMWYLSEIPFDGVRIDAVKHISPLFFNEWLDYMRTIKPDLFAVGEYWAPGHLHLLCRYIEATEGRMSLFDASLHHNLYYASKEKEAFDLRTIFNNSLVSVNPGLAVTVVDNHDTQPLQSLEAPVEAWFKPHAYSLILLREGGYPCIFYPDLYGVHYIDKGPDGQDHEIWLEKCPGLQELLLLRKERAYGLQRDFFDDSNCIGWTRDGGDMEGAGCAIIISNAGAKSKRMEIGQKFAGSVFIDQLKNRKEEVIIDNEGYGEFFVNERSVSVWIVN